jgi:hypothetical protein
MQVQYKVMNCNKLEIFRIHGALLHTITKLMRERRKISKFRPDASQGCLLPHQIHRTSFKRNRAKTSSYKLLSEYTSQEKCAQHEDLTAGQVGECPSSVCNACLERQGNTEDCSPPSYASPWIFLFTYL